MNNTENAFVDADLRPDVDRDRLLAQIAQGLLTAHARLDLMEERLVQATSRTVVEQLTSAVSIIKANERISSAQLMELKEVLQVLDNAKQTFSSAATQAIDKQVDRIHAAQSDSLSKLSANQAILESIVSETAYKSNKLLETQSHEHKTNLAGIHKDLKTQMTEMRKTLKEDIAKVQAQASTAQDIMQQNTNQTRDIASARFKQQVILVSIACLCILTFLGTRASTLPYEVKIAIYVSTFVITLMYSVVLYQQSDEDLLKNINAKRLSSNHQSFINRKRIS